MYTVSIEEKIEQLLEKADAAIDLDRYDLAIELANEVLKQEPEESRAYVLLARAWFLKDELFRASESIREALKLDPEDSCAHTLYALILAEWGEKKEARQEFEKALELDPFSSVSHRCYAMFLLDQLKKKEKARFHAEKALELDPEEAENHLAFGRILAACKEYEMAEKSFEEALRLEPENFNVQLGSGMYWMYERNDPKKAYPFFREAVRLNPEEKEVRDLYFHALKSKNKLYFLLFSILLPIGRFGTIGIFGLYFGLRFMNIILENLNYVQLAEIFYILSMTFAYTILLFWLVDKILHYLIKKGWYLKNRS